LEKRFNYIIQILQYSKSDFKSNIFIKATSLPFFYHMLLVLIFQLISSEKQDGELTCFFNIIFSHFFEFKFELGEVKFIIFISL